MGDFTREDVIDTIWSARKLVGADLRGIDLNAANLSLANLHNAELCDANLNRADLRGANLTGAHLVNTNLEKAKCNRFTTWPDGFDPILAGAEFLES